MDGKNLLLPSDNCEIRRPLAVVRKPLPKISRSAPAQLPMFYPWEDIKMSWPMGDI